MKKINELLNRTTLIDKDKLFRYFEVKLDITNFKNGNYYLTFRLNIKNTNYTAIEYSISNKEEENSTCLLCGNENCDHIACMIQEYEKLHPNKIANTIYEIENEDLLRKQKQVQESFTSLFNKIKEDIEFEEENEYENKISLKLFINTMDNTLYFKIGREKYYIIKNIYKFLNSIKYQEEISYGKELKFIHNIKAFDKLGQDVIEVLEKHSTYEEFNNSRIELNDSLLKDLITLYKDKTICIDDMNYIVALHKIKPKLHIRNDGTINIVGLDNYHFILESNTYIFNDYSRSVDYLGNDDSLYKFIYAVYINKGATILPIIEDFKLTIYLKYKDYFSFEDDIGMKLAFNDIKIESYFDLDDEMIKLTTKIFADDKQIEEENYANLKSKLYYKYLRIIDKLGFINNVLNDEDLIINFLESDLSSLKEISDVYLSETIKSKVISKFSKPSFRINYGNDLLNIFIEESKYDEDELSEILKAIRKKKKYVLLDNSIIRIDNENAKVFKEIADDFKYDDNLLEEKHVPLYQAFKSYAYENDIKLDSLIDTLFNDIKNFKDLDIEPPLLQTSLRSYQLDAFKWLSVLYKYNLGGILADDMGLGKTIETIALISSIKEQKPIIIVTPKSLIYNWQSEFVKFNDNIVVVPIYGTTKQRHDIINSINPNKKVVYLTSYDTLRSDIDLYELVDFNLCILDEAQFIKNSSALKTKSVKQLNALHRLVLTGTPIENNILDLWSIFDFLMPGYLPNIKDFKSKYENDDNYSDVIYKKIAPFILRRTKEEVLKDLPPKYEVIITCEMNEAQKKLYEAHRLQARNLMKTEAKTIELIALFTRLRQICVEPSMFIENYTHGSAKLDTLKEIIDSKIKNNHRILIFSQFVKSLEIIEKYLNYINIKHFKIIGDTKAKDRVSICEEFNNNEEYKIVLISLKAGGTGLNLVGADTVIHLDPWWNTSAQDQATDRTHRIGQTRTVEEIKLICSNSIEQKVQELQNKKKEVINKFISNDDSSITSISKEDLIYILD